ncbi:kinase-like domain-containing protein [Polychytrium aggregatum]|uniref:kinase-like domain-containing protein n=1 Tax=Polychytrium aggregatum TaxID=110093 RepID=UPI0022FDDEF2|nr:kinase-like domain-containing protein [Polychytrium aggregatum]KAI9197510.1 kinase-like domain-containing protein [Polychytrium aggregatum]
MVFYNQAGCALTSSDDRGMIDNRYYIFKSNVLGEGTFAKVYLAINVKTGLRLACKIFPRTRPGASIRTGDAASSAQTESIQKEISILQEINHPNIVSIHDYIEDKQAAYIFLTRMAGGELFDYIINHNGIPEYEAKFIFYQALVAVEYLHNRHIAHRDLKPENFLFESPKPFSRLILTDFGLAKMTNDYLGRMKTKCGTFSYLAPEVLEVKNTCQGYSARVDCWSLGVLLFTMLSATLPFGSDEDLAVLNHRVKHGLYSFPDKDGWDKITDSAKDLIRSLLRSNPEDRLSIEQIFEHPWIASQRDLLAKLYQKMLEKCGLSVEAVESAASSHSAAAPKRPFDEMHDSSATVSPHVRKRPVI